jgi:hypothetical protein
MQKLLRVFALIAITLSVGAAEPSNAEPVSAPLSPAATLTPAAPWTPAATWTLEWPAALDVCQCCLCYQDEPSCPTGFHYDFTGLINSWLGGNKHPWCVPYLCRNLHSEYLI